ncbi:MULTISPECIES: hypothetical protein [unclassified Bradyrhizobium]|uniref:hypothetical protein n=1 Tax=unclassified Bradyrhizobium TaxID=2631580 RepID=UPI002305E710|nr:MULTISPECIES: hypothetical protein [unclassified Bradyrhizobium]MDA9412882.1 hypothetical protein [Bradyrhizobium sp. CCBAU 45384]MDA9438428.1 hypothetical protein [Bradyrhizobium sp. CCBAU 51745]
MLSQGHVQQAAALEERLIREAQTLRAEAKLLPEGLLRDAALRKALQIDTAVIWFNSPGVRQSNGSDSD